MRYLRGTIAATAALVLSGAAAGTAMATPPTEPTGSATAAGLYAPSALVLTVGKGTSAPTATVERAVTLSCAPRAMGTHPAPRAACNELRTVNGHFAELATRLPQTLCTREYDPVTVTAEGVWRGERVTWNATYNNPCEMEATLGQSAVFSF
ncbi:subtilase-type protease inhibitor [Streptomyces sp. NPDC057638]|uniref:subtilase-type protease inhibitor n=1 Tax=Streptomyces sp. NPDC057638 TaxID=3346190 RepID=UPI003685F7F5